MPADRRPYQRASEEARREAMIRAVLDLVAEGGLQTATVRAIADRAGVTPGLIGHYFGTKEDLTRAAYRQMMDRMTADNETAIAAAGTADRPAAQRLADFVATALRPPVMDALRLGLWASFLQAIRREPEMREIHRQTYLSYRDILEQLIGALNRPGADAARCRADAIACNALIDGLWLEGAALPEDFEPGALERIGLAAVAAILGVTLPPPAPPAPGAPA